ncbi:MAG TPA: hypothetical protein VNU64_24805 [Burkholderiales bacterium]|nr:hypothetical protein [Burkholderiales bacterium]
MTSTSATLPALTNGSAVYVAVSAANAAGESDLSNETCAVPTAASTAGLTLLDSLCSGTLDAAKWRSPVFSRSVVNGAMSLSAELSNMEPLALRGASYVNTAAINAGSQRVTTVRTEVRVPGSAARRTGGAELVAGIVFAYQPPADRHAGDRGEINAVRAQVGLVDSGRGLRVFRAVNHCDTANCSANTSTGVAFSDPAELDASGEAAAAYDTTYTFSLNLDETSGVFTWSVSGGGYAGVTGTMDAVAYLAGNSSWTALGSQPFGNGGGFELAALRTRFRDLSSAGGSNAAIAAEFDSVQVGFDNNPATAWDSFSGTGTDSGPTELSAAKWTPGRDSAALGAGALVHHAQVTNSGSGFLPYFQGLIFSDPTPKVLQADFTMNACSGSATNRASLEASFYNDGSGGTTPPDINQPGSIVGDVRAYLYLDCIAQVARFQVLRWDSNSPLTGTLLSNFSASAVPMGSAPFFGSQHTLRMKWDSAAHMLTFQVNGQTPVLVDPTAAGPLMNAGAPFVQAANSPLAQIGAFVDAAPSSAASIDFRVNNVFTAP